MVVAAALFPAGYFLSARIMRILRTPHVIELSVALGVLIADICVIVGSVSTFRTAATDNLWLEFGSFCE